MRAGVERGALASTCLLLALACRQAEAPPPLASTPIPEQEAKALVEQARRDVERGSAGAAPLAAGTRV
jgi:hypothetical protein